MELAGFAEATGMLRSGVYALAFRGEVVYVGKSKAMLARINTHRQNWNAKRRGKVPSWLPVQGIQFDEVFIRPCHVDALDELERQMINLYKPRLNTLLKTSEKINSPIEMNINGHIVVMNRRPEPLVRRC